MSRSVEFYNHEKHRDRFEAWCQAHEVECPPVEILPTVGLVCVVEGAPRALCFMYMDVRHENGTGSGVAMMAWLTTDPDNSALETRRCLKALSETFELQMKAYNYGTVINLVKPEHQKFWESMGYTPNHSVLPMLKGVE